MLDKAPSRQLRLGARKQEDKSMQVEEIAKALKELGHPIRLTIYKTLVKAGHQGLTVGDLQARLKIPNSTLSHHISSLISANLIKQERQGRSLFCIARYQQLQSVIAYLLDECCIEEVEKEEENQFDTTEKDSEQTQKSL